VTVACKKRLQACIYSVGLSMNPEDCCHQSKHGPKRG